METTLTSKLALEMFLGVVGGLGLFLLGMKNMSEGMQAIAGSKLRKMIGSVTSNRFAACGIGTTVTALIQSSSVTTVMVVGFVNAGFMTLKQSIGVILGSNIGTTATAWIIAGLPIGKYGLPILGISAFFFLFSRNEKLRYTGMTIMGIGMVFFGLELMSQGMKPMRTVPEFQQWFSMFTANTYPGVLKCALVGALLTALVQSSSATVGLTMSLAMNNVIGFETAAALVLGENIGTTVTALLASIGASTNGKRAAISHTIFNVIGVLWITAVFHPYIKIIRHMMLTAPETAVMNGAETIYPHMKTGIAMVHSGFNIANTILFLPLISILTVIVTRLVPDKPHKEAPHLTFLDVRMLDTPAIGIQQSFVEILKMGEHVKKMFSLLKDVTTTKELDDKKTKKIFHREEILDVVQKEVMEFLSNMLSGNIPHDVIKTSRKHLRIADEYESISDYIVNILKLHLKLRSSNMELSEQGMKEVLMLHDRIVEYVDMINKAVAQNNTDIESKAHSRGDAITHIIKDCREKHLEQVAMKSVSPLNSLIFTDILQSYRKIKDHAVNIAEALAGEK